jgi:hypothetical protein
LQTRCKLAHDWAMGWSEIVAWVALGLVLVNGWRMSGVSFKVIEELRGRIDALAGSEAKVRSLGALVDELRDEAGENRDELLAEISALRLEVLQLRGAHENAVAAQDDEGDAIHANY